MEQLWADPAIVAGMISSDYVTAVLADAPTAWWRMGEKSGTTLVDRVAARNATLQGKFTLGVQGGIYNDGDTACNFDGKSGKADVPFAGALNPALWTLEAIVKRTASNPTNNPVCDCRPASSGPTAAGYDLFINGDGGYGISICSNNVAQTLILATVPFLSAAKELYHHVAASYDGAAGRIYLDGVLVGGPVVCPFTPNPTNGLGIGHLNGATGGNLAAATIDELVIYSARLSDARVAAHAAALIPTRKSSRLDQRYVRVASELAPTHSPAPAGHAIVPAGWVLMMGDEGEPDRFLVDARQNPAAYLANMSSLTVPYYSGGWPPDPQSGSPGHTPPTQ